MDRTTQAIEHLYATFGNYRIGKHVHGCPCCVSRRDEEALTAHRLRDLPSADLESFAASALYTWGDEGDFKHFLPRICELLVEPGADRLLTDAQTVFSKLPYASWRSWPEEEQRAVTRFLRDTWTDLLSTHPTTTRLDDWLECAGIAEERLDFYLNAFSNAPLSEAASHLADFILENIDGIASGTIRWIWWKPAHDTIVPWLKGPVPSSILTQAFEAELEHSEAGNWARAIDVLSLLAP